MYSPSACRGCNDEMIKMHLINSYCKPLLLCGCECYGQSKSDINSISRAWNIIFLKLFAINDPVCIILVSVCTGIRSIQEEIMLRRTNFIVKLKVSTNSVMTSLSLFC